MTWRANNGRGRTFIDGIMWIPDGPSSDYKCYSTKEQVKTFIIDHPLQTEKYLVHACLEGPEAGVYYRGTGVITSESKSVEIHLADYVEELAFDFTIHVTPYLSDDDKEKEPYFPKLITTDVKNGMFTVYSDIVPCKFNYLVFGTRQNIEVEPLKELTYVKGDGPYKWI